MPTLAALLLALSLLASCGGGSGHQLPRTPHAGAASSNATPAPLGNAALGFSAITVCVNKWGTHLPHVRQSGEMAALGCPIPDAQLWQQAELLARTLEPTYDAIDDYVANSELIHADETPWPLLSKGSKKWWAWTFSNYDSVHICIDPSRGH
ncbi:MAG: transposase [Myxococcales bacterium]|nr:transposase [Myxococcales bacterium]